MLIKLKTAQSTLEYALLIGVVVGGLLTMQNYLKRSIQGKMQATADEISPDQYSPGLTKKDDYMFTNIGNIEEVSIRGHNTLTTTTISNAHQESTTDREIKPLDKEKWPAKTQAQQQ